MKSTKPTNSSRKLHKSSIPAVNALPASVRILIGYLVAGLILVGAIILIASVGGCATRESDSRVWMFYCLGFCTKIEVEHEEENTTNNAVIEEVL